MQTYKLTLILGLIALQIVVALVLVGGIPRHLWTARGSFSVDGSTVLSPSTPTATATPSTPKASTVAVAPVLTVATAAPEREVAPTATPRPVEVVATPTATSRAVEVAATPTATATPDATAPSPTATAVPQATPTPAPVVMAVRNTGEFGLNLRREPTTASEAIRAWREGSLMVIVGPIAESEGFVWINVQDPLGNIGWVPEQHLAPP